MLLLDLQVILALSARLTQVLTRCRLVYTESALMHLVYTFVKSNDNGWSSGLLNNNASPICL